MHLLIFAPLISNGCSGGWRFAYTPYLLFFVAFTEKTSLMAVIQTKNRVCYSCDRKRISSFGDTIKYRAPKTRFQG